MYLTMYGSSSMVRIFLGMGLLLAFGSGGGWFGNKPVDDLRASGVHGFSRQAAGAGSGPCVRPIVANACSRTEIGTADSMTTGMRFQSSSRQTAP
jgi:hypothetical protein